MPQFRENIKKMSPYKPPLEGRSDGDFLFLDFNERTIGPGPKVQEALKRFVDSGQLQVYPEYGDLEKKIARYAGVGEEQAPTPTDRWWGQAIVVNGGDQGIDIICRAHLGEGDKVIIPKPGFAMHNQSAELQDAEILEPSYNEDGFFPTQEALDLISQDAGIKLVILCNPNNPLGTSIAIEDVEKILGATKERGIAVLHDEAYFEFSGITAKDLIKDYNNLYIIRTFSKAFGLVATRVGYVLSQEENLEQLLKIRGPYDVNMFAKVAVLAALEDIGYMKDYVGEVMEKSKPKLEEFFKTRGVDFFPSSANFLFLQVDHPEEIIEGLKKQGILVRPKKGPGAKPGIRVAIGTQEDTQRFISAYLKFYARA